MLCFRIIKYIYFLPTIRKRDKAELGVSDDFIYLYWRVRFSTTHYYMCIYPANTRRWAKLVQMLYKSVVFAGVYAVCIQT